MKYLLLGLLLLFPVSAQAELVGKTIDYTHEGSKLQGYLVYDNSFSGQRPGVIVVHDWMGFGLYSNRRAEMLAELGYVAFALDMYGKDKVPKNAEEASKESTIYKSNRPLMRERARAGYNVLKQHPLADPDRMAAIGYCFGGTVVLEMARAGLELDGVVSFHGGLDSTDPMDGYNIKGKVLTLHGADDPLVSATDLAAFKSEMETGGVSYTFVEYKGAVHSFTQKKADEDTFDATAYNEFADKDSWEKMQDFLNEVFLK